MNVVDLHPEDLLDKLASGSISPEERERLQAHLRGCSECRFELAVRGDLADEALSARPPVAAPLGPRPEPAPQRTPSRRPPRRALLLPAVAAALVAGGALAAVVSEVVRSRHAEQMAHVERVVPPVPVETRVVAPRVTTPVVTVPAPSAAVTPTLAEPPAPAPRARTMALPPSRPSAAPPLPSAAALPDAAPSRSAAGLFSAANRARRYGDTAQAMSLYRSLQDEFPSSEEARLSRATLATLQLDRGDASAALDGFDRYLAQGGAALGAEALVGRAVALGRLGQSSAELAAWREVARRFPGTAHAKRAAARIAVLSAR